MSTPPALIAILYKFKRAEPDLYKQLLKEFSLHTDRVTAAVTDADAQEIMTAKGYALHARWFLRQLVECHLPFEPKQ